MISLSFFVCSSQGLWLWAIVCNRLRLVPGLERHINPHPEEFRRPRYNKIIDVVCVALASTKCFAFSSTWKKISLFDLLHMLETIRILWANVVALYHLLELFNRKMYYTFYEKNGDNHSPITVIRKTGCSLPEARHLTFHHTIRTHIAEAV